MEIVKPKKTLLTAALLILVAPGQASSELPELKMYVFNQESDPGKHSTPNNKGMKMVIYGSDAQEFDAFQSEAAQSEAYAEQGMTLEFYAETGYRQDELDWTIASPTQIILDQPGINPNILSELTWDNIEIITIGLGTTIRTSSNWVFNGEFVYGHIIDGNNQDSDFLGDNRTREFSRSENNADEGSVLDFSLSAGYQLDFGKMRNKKPIFSLIPKVGFSYHAQNLNMTNGLQTISRPDLIDDVNERNRLHPSFEDPEDLIDNRLPEVGNFGGLDSSYEASWYGPWAGVDTQISFGPYFSILGSFEYHYAYYEATAEWNLQTDFAQPESFTHEAEGTGINASIGSRINLDDDLSLNLSIDYKRWDADKKGIDTVFFSNGTTVETGFNGVNWKSMGANLGIQYAF